jgi:hypothetical protein
VDHRFRSDLVAEACERCLDVAEREGVEGVVPGEVGAVEEEAAPATPLVEPRDSRFVLAGLVVDVRDDVCGRRAVRLLGERAIGELARFVVMPLLFVDHGEQRVESPVPTQTVGIGLDERLRPLSISGDAAHDESGESKLRTEEVVGKGRRVLDEPLDGRESSTGLPGRARAAASSVSGSGVRPNMAAAPARTMCSRGTGASASARSDSARRSAS